MRRACSCVPPQIRAKVISAGPKSMLVTSPPHPVQLATNDDNHEDSSVTGALRAVLRSSSAKETSPARRDALGGCARLPRASQTPWSGPRPGSREETGAFRSALPAADRHSSAQTPLPANRLSRPQVAGLVHRPAGAAAYRARSQSHRPLRYQHAVQAAHGVRRSGRQSRYFSRQPCALHVRIRAWRGEPAHVPPQIQAA
jgi:hypothetical protein